jgi:hypothetical protein
MSLLQNLNKKSMTIAATVVAVLVGGVGVSFALSAIPDFSNDNPATTTIAGVPTSVVANVADSAVSVVVPGSTAASSRMTGSTSTGSTSTDSTISGSGATIPGTTSSSSISATPMTSTVGAPPAVSIGGGVGGDDDDDGDDDHDDDDDHDEEEGDDDGDDD